MSDEVLLGRPEPSTSATGSDATAYRGPDATAYRMVETHLSVLFFVGDRVYKLRKPVRFEFVDFTTREARRIDCQREVDLNRRLAPDVYLGVMDMALGGHPVDHMVVMRRMDGERRLSDLASRGVDLEPWLRDIAGQLSSFHRAATRAAHISAAGAPEALWAGWEANFTEVEPFVGNVLDAEIDAEIRVLAHRWIEGRQPLLADRIERGRICDGHGDLEAEDIFCLDDGARILDCIEFSDELRHVDQVADIAFLAMDLERVGRRQAAESFVAHYKVEADDTVPDSLVHHYAASRAYVRAKVLCLRAVQGSPSSARDAAELHRLAHRLVRRGQVQLLVVGGLPGSGKSTLAREIAAARGWSVFSSDELRREAYGFAGPAPGYGAGRYDADATERIYRELLRRAEYLMGMGYSVVLDASWIDAEQRARARELAVRTSSRLIELRCDTTVGQARDRIAERLVADPLASEATAEVYLAMRERMDAWSSATVIDTSGPRTATVAKALGILSTTE